MKMLDKIRSKWLILMLLFVFVLLVAVYLIPKPALWESWDLSEKGSIGDALNGITAPFIGTVGALLIYFSFREQQQANEIQFKALREQRTIDFIFRSYEELKDDLEKIQADFGDRYGQKSMLDAYMQQILQDTHEKSYYPELHDFVRYLNVQLFYLGGMLLGSDRKIGRENSQFLLFKVQHLYILYFKNYYDQVMSSAPKSELATDFRSNIYMVHTRMRHVDENLDYLLGQDMKDAVKGPMKA